MMKIGRIFGIGRSLTPIAWNCGFICYLSSSMSLWSCFLEKIRSVLGKLSKVSHFEELRPIERLLGIQSCPGVSHVFQVMVNLVLK